AVAGGGGVEGGDLVAPGAVEGVLHDRHQLDVGEAGALDVLGQAGGQLAIAEGAVGVLRAAHPGAEVDLVDRHRRVEGVAGPATVHAVGVVPVVVECADDGGGERRHLSG